MTTASSAAAFQLRQTVIGLQGHTATWDFERYRLLTIIVGKSLNRMRLFLGMRGCFVFRVFLASALLIQAQQAFSCSFAVGYFHQVTRLRGIVVGTGNYWPLLGYSSYPRWIRQRVKRGDAVLRLHDYRWPGSVRERQPIATVRTDERGRFDFGSLQEGHYTLVIDWAAEYSDQFDVEIKKLPAETSTVKIDVSPVDPDCTGGHEFISYSTK